MALQLTGTYALIALLFSQDAIGYRDSGIFPTVVNSFSRMIPQ
jgi:hypothetical protein